MRKNIISLLILFSVANAFAQNNTLNDAFIKSCQEGNISTVQALLASGANVNYLSSNSGIETTPLIEAINAESLPVVTFLVESGATINLKVKSYFGVTALEVAVSTLNKEIVQCLLSKGAENKPVILLAAIKYGFQLKADQKTTQRLEKMWFEFRNKKIEPEPFVDTWITHQSAKVVNILDILIQNGSNVNFISTRGETPLMAAAKSYLPSEFALFRYPIPADITNYLLGKGANPEYVNKDHRYALSVAAVNLNLKVAKKLIKEKNKINYANPKDNKTLLLSLLSNIYFDDFFKVLQQLIMTDLLLDTPGVDVNHKDKNGKTALHYIVAPSPVGSHTFSGFGPKWASLQLGIIRKLKEKGADINIKDNEGNTPLVYAIQRNNSSVQEELLRTLPKKQPVISNEEKEKSMKIFRFFMNHKHSVSCKTEILSERNVSIENKKEMNFLLSEFEKYYKFEIINGRVDYIDSRNQTVRKLGKDSFYYTFDIKKGGLITIVLKGADRNGSTFKVLEKRWLCADHLK